MTKNEQLAKRMNLFALTWPVLVETTLRILLETADIAMLSRYSDEAVAAVGLIGTISFFIYILFMLVVTGSTTLISQYNGADNYDGANHIASSSILLVGVVAVVTTVGLTVFGSYITAIYDLEPMVNQYANEYLFIFGLFSLGLALSVTFASILRANGFTRSPMIVLFICNCLNVCGNYIAIFGPFGIPIYGVAGVALSTVLSNLISAIVLFVLVMRKEEIVLSCKIPNFGWHLKQILYVGLPNAGEMLSFNFAQLVSYKVVTVAGTAALSATVYCRTAQRFSMIIPYALMQSIQILVGYLVGKGKVEEADRQTIRAAFTALAIVLATIIAALFFRYEIMGLFTNDAEIIDIGVALIIVSVFWETGRTFNLIIGGALKGAGDIHFPVRIGIISMWLVATAGSYLFGLYFALGAVGMWIAFSLDECCRGVLMLFRWRSGVWKTKRLV